MQQELANLITVLEEQRDIQAALVGLSEKKIAVIATGDVGALNEVTEQESAMVARIAAVERKQTACVTALATFMGIPAAQLRMQAVITAARGSHKQHLITLRDELTSLVEKQVKYNDMNRRLLEMNMEHIQFLLNRNGIEKAAPTYGSDGDVQQLRAQIRLLDRKV